MNAKILVNYICHFVNESSVERYNVIKSACESMGYDIKYIIPNVLGDETVDLTDFEGVDFVRCDIDKDHQCFNMKNNYHYNNNLTYCHVFGLFNDYDYYYFIEHDCLFKNNTAANWERLFDKYAYEMDLLCCHHNEYDENYRAGLYSIDHMIAMNTTMDGEVVNDGMILVDNKLMKDDIYFAFMPLCKISKSLMEKVAEYYAPLTTICPFFEYVIPTIAHKNDMVIVDFSKDDSGFTQFVEGASTNAHFLINNGSMSWYLEDKSQYSDGTLIHPQEC